MKFECVEGFQQEGAAPAMLPSHVRTLHTAPGLEATVHILAKKNMMSVVKFIVKLDCHIFWTLGCHHTNSMETCFRRWMPWLLLDVHWVECFVCVKPPKRLHVLDSVTKACFHKVSFTKSRKFKFWVGYPLNAIYSDLIWCLEPADMINKQNHQKVLDYQIERYYSFIKD